VSDNDPTYLEMLADYECPECGPMVEVCEEIMVTEEEAAQCFFDDDETGVMRCPNDFCDCELERTLSATLDMAKMFAERRPDLAEAIAQAIDDKLTEAIGEL
jgi:hypothetical protein